MDIIDGIAIDVTINAEDYQQDGLWYCGKCHTPKQLEFEFMDRPKKVFCLCKCMTEARDKDIADRAEQEQKSEIERMKRIGFWQSDMSDWTFANDDMKHPKETGIAKKYVENFELMKQKGKGLLFYGNVGTGKTYLASCIANALIEKGIPCLVTNFARLVNTLSGMREGKQEYIDSINRYSLLVIDDLSAERNTEYMNEIVWNVIDARYRLGLPLIVTTNLTAQELYSPAELNKERIYSRVLEMCVPISLSGEDRRKTKMKETYHEMEEILGL